MKWYSNIVYVRYILTFTVYRQSWINIADAKSFLFVEVNVCWKQKFCRRNFVGSKFYLVNKYLTTACIYVREDVKSWTRITHENHEHWSPRNNEDSTVLLNIFKIVMYICCLIYAKYTVASYLNVFLFFFKIHANCETYTNGSE